MKNIEHILKIYEIAWLNVRHNATIRNRYFSLFLIISGTFFVIIDKLSVGTVNKLIPALPFVAALFIFVVSLLFVSMFIRVRKVILRDLAVIKDISDYIIKQEEEGISSAIKTYTSFYGDKKQNKIYKLFAASKMLWLATVLISSLIMVIGIRAWKNVNSLDLIFIFFLLILLHVIYEYIAGRLINS